MATEVLELAPDKFLTFAWDKWSDVPVAMLHASNSSSTAYMAYKVKTTAPKRYVVRPPQGCIEPGRTATIKLTMVQKDAEALWREALDDRDVKSDDKFLVQTSIVSAAYFHEELAGQDDKMQSTSLQKLWKTLGEEDKKSDKKVIKSSKLTTKFSFPNNMGDVTVATMASPPPVQPATSVTEAAASVAAAAAAVPSAAPPESASAALKAHGGGEPAASAAGMPGSPEQVFAELAALRKKYDDLVAYTVVLTGERDYLQQECEDKTNSLHKAEAEAAKAVAAAKASSGSGAAATAATGAGEKTSTVTSAPSGTGPAGFAFVHVLVVALVAFVVGRILG